MSAIKFPHVFAALLIISGVCAFFVPERYTVRAQPQVQSIFQPVAWPVRSVARWMNEHLFKPPPRDARDKDTIVSENEELRQEVARLTTVVDKYRQREDLLGKLGSIRELCKLFQVVGPAQGSREAILLTGTSFDGLKQNQAVLFHGGIAGRIERPPGLLGAQVRLITDPGMRTEGYFAGFIDKQHVRRPTDAALFEGIGDGTMICRGLTTEQVQQAKVEPGDGVFLQDKDWDERLHGMRLGRVVRIDQQAAHPLYAEIRVKPTSNLLRLTDVMVVTK